MARTTLALSSQQLSRQLYLSQKHKQEHRIRQSRRRGQQAQNVARSVALPTQSYLETLGYKEQSLFRTLLGFFTPITIFIILLKLSMCWVIYTTVVDHLSFMERELAVDSTYG